MSVQYRLVGYKDILGSRGEFDNRNDIFVGSYHHDLDEAIAEAKTLLRKGTYFHITIMEVKVSFRRQIVKPEEVEIEMF